MKNRVARLIAFYLPQYHTISENDKWWGKGFTEWTNVAKAKPLFRGHEQPKIPADLGFYDLRVPEVREAQAQLAEDCGIEGFAYWHYWFGNGKRLLERPFNEVLKSGKPDFPFCLAWANESWTGIWHGLKDKVLMEQTYNGRNDYENHFYAILPALKDNRYLKINNKPMFLVFKPENLPNTIEFINIWKQLAVKEGLEGIYFIAVQSPKWNYKEFGFDNITFHLPPYYYANYNPPFLKDLIQRLKNKIKTIVKGPTIYDYEKTACYNLFDKYRHIDFIPSIMPNWDNTPRSSRRGIVFINSTPNLFEKHLSYTVDYVQHKPLDERVIFLKSWNEWAEGNYLEPDQKWGRGYLEAIYRAVNGTTL